MCARFGLNRIAAAIGRLLAIDILVALLDRAMVTAAIVIVRVGSVRVESQRMYRVCRPVMGVGVRRRGRDDAKMRQGDRHADHNDPANPIHVPFFKGPFVTPA